MKTGLPLACGHLEGERRGDDLFLRCIKCGEEELVVGYEHNKHPQKFMWAPIAFDGVERAVCNKCGEKYERVIPGAR